MPESVETEKARGARSNVGFLCLHSYRSISVHVDLHITNQQRMSLVGELGDRKDESQRIYMYQSVLGVHGGALGRRICRLRFT